MKLSRCVFGVITCFAAGFVPAARAGITIDAAQAALTPRACVPVKWGVAGDGTGESAGQAARAFDGLLNTSWQTTVPGGETGRLEFHFADDVRWLLTGYSIASGTAGEDRDPREWELQGSNDGLDWVKLDARNRQIFIGRRKANSYKVRLSEAYSRYRFVFAPSAAESRLEVSEVGFTVKALTLPPEEVSAETERGCAILQWSAVESAAGYTVRRASDSQGPYVILASGVQGTRYTDRGPFGEGELSYYTVSTDAPAVQGLASAAASALTPVAAPTNLKAKTGTGLVVLEWTPSPKAAAYVVRRSLAREGPYTVVGSLITAPAYKDEGLSAGTAYHYVVCGVANGKEGIDTAPVSALFPPSAPTGLTAEPGRQMITLKWNAVALAKAYKVMRAALEDGLVEELATVTDGTAFVDKSVNSKKTYRYTVAAVNDCGSGVASDPVSASSIRSAAWWR